MSLPEVEERLSHGEPAWFITKGKQFVSVKDHLHGASHLGFWCAGPVGMQGSLVQSRPDQFFVPPYVGHRGWIGVRLDRSPDWDEITVIVVDAYLTVAPKRLGDRLAYQSDDVQSN
jgi:hypothetical protein